MEKICLTERQRKVFERKLETGILQALHGDGLLTDSELSLILEKISQQ